MKKAELLFFTDNAVYFYRDLNVCVGSEIRIDGAGFQEASELFQEKLFGVDPMTRPTRLHWIPMKTKNARREQYAVCDLLVYQAEDGAFPFNYLKDALPNESSKMPQMVLGLFYRNSDDSLPVIRGLSSSSRRPNSSISRDRPCIGPGPHHRTTFDLVDESRVVGDGYEQ